MKLAKYIFPATAIFLLSTPISGSDPESTIKSDNVAIQFRLTKLVYERAHRTTFWIEMKADRMGLGVSAVCDLRKDGVGVGRFPLEQVESKEEGNAVTFRISCLQDEFIEDTVVHVSVRDEATGKTIESNRLRLKDAESARRPSASAEAIPEVDEATAIGNVQSLTGKWKAVESSYRALDAKLVKSEETGFEIAIDRRLGDSLRRSSVSYFDRYSAIFEEKGHAIIATGTIQFQYGGESEFVMGTIVEQLTEIKNRCFGYARVSTDDQNLSMQIDALIRFGVEPVNGGGKVWR